MDAEQAFIDPAMARTMIANLSLGLRVDEDGRSTKSKAPTSPKRDSQPRRGQTAKQVLDPETYHAIRTDFPGWDYDELMRRFDAFLGANPLELPRNYSKRFYGFVKEHHRRNKFRL